VNARAASVPADSALIEVDQGLALTIAERGWAHVRAFLPDPIWKSLATELRAAQAEDKLRRAGIGSGEGYRLAEEFRGDRIRWLERAPASAAQRQVLARLEQLRLTCNRELQLGLFEFEGHFAVYPEGAGYRRHRDQPRDSDARVLSCVLYLNDAWQPQDGGALRLYLDEHGEARHVDILPEGGALVCFLSAHFFHEVVPARRERLSLTGWFRRRAD
jgi:SM-20-related protein